MLKGKTMATKSVYKRNTKFWGIETTKEFECAFQKTQKTLNRISRYIRKKLKSGEIIKLSANYITFEDGSVLTNAKFKDSMHHLFDEDAKSETVKRECVIYILERYAGYFRRNGKKKIPNIAIKGKGLYYRDSLIKINREAKTLIIPTMYEKFELKYKNSIREKYLTKDKVAGNLIYKQKAFVVAVDVSFVPLYEPTCTRGFDMNKERRANVAFNDGEIIPSSTIMIEYITKINKINELLDADKKLPISSVKPSGTVSLRKLRSKQRRPLRLEWIKLHKKLGGETKKVASYILQKTQEEQALLCIDSVGTGQMMGTFGQDHLIPELQKECENRGIPFYVVPCRNTSRRCGECGYIDAENRKDTQTFECTECKHKADAQLNAAINIAHIGQTLYDAGVPYGNYAETRDLKKLISSHQKESIPVSAE